LELILWKLRAIFVKKNCLSNSLKFLGRLRLKQILGRANRNKETISRQGMYAEGQQKNLCVWSNWIQFVVRMDTIQGPSQIPLTVWPRSPGSDTPQKIIEACQKSIPVVLLWNKKIVVTEYLHYQQTHRKKLIKGTQRILQKQVEQPCQPLDLQPTLSVEYPKLYSTYIFQTQKILLNKITTLHICYFELYPYSKPIIHWKAQWRDGENQNLCKTIQSKWVQSKCSQVLVFSLLWFWWTGWKLLWNACRELLGIHWDAKLLSFSLRFWKKVMWLKPKKKYFVPNLWHVSILLFSLLFEKKCRDLNPKKYFVP